MTGAYPLALAGTRGKSGTARATRGGRESRSQNARYRAERHTRDRGQTRDEMQATSYQLTPAARTHTRHPQAT